MSSRLNSLLLKQPNHPDLWGHELVISEQSMGNGPRVLLQATLNVWMVSKA